MQMSMSVYHKKKRLFACHRSSDMAFLLVCSNGLEKCIDLTNFMHSVSCSEMKKNNIEME